MRLKWDIGGWLDVAELLLLLELLVGGLNGDGEADLGLLLWRSTSAFVYFAS